MKLLFIFIIFLAIIAALVINVTLNEHTRHRILKIMIGFALVTSFIIYGTAYLERYGEDVGDAAINTVFSIFSMFAGNHDFELIEDQTIMQNNIVVVIYWISHLAALYSTATAVIEVIAQKAMRRLALLFVLKKRLVMIYGSSEEGIAYARKCAEEKKNSVLVIFPGIPEETADELCKEDVVVLSDQEAVHPTPVFLRSIGISGKKCRLPFFRVKELDVFALDELEYRNFEFASEMISAMKTNQVKAEKTRLTLRGIQDANAAKLQNTSQQYGFGFVEIVDAPELAARQLIMRTRPWELISFDKDCLATENMDVLVIGFGDYGQAALRHLVMNGQFEGARFHAAVMSPAAGDEAGSFRATCKDMFSRYDIEFIEGDGRGKALYDHLDSYPGKLDLIAICTDSEIENRAIADDLIRYYEFRTEKPLIAECAPSGVLVHGEMNTDGEKGAERNVCWPIFDTETLDNRKMDHMAMLLNASYMTDDPLKDPIDSWEYWKECDFFSRNSSRAFADFIPAYLFAAGITEGEAMASPGMSMLSEKQKENLGRTEHLRWCAFHFANGWKEMERSEWNSRAAKFSEEAEALIPVNQELVSRGEKPKKPKTRITKNSSGKTHGCLISWEDLKELDAREEQVTKKDPDYQRADIRNIESISILLQKKQIEEKSRR